MYNMRLHIYNMQLHFMCNMRLHIYIYIYIYTYNMTQKMMLHILFVVYCLLIEHVYNLLERRRYLQKVPSVNIPCIWVN